MKKLRLEGYPTPKEGDWVARDFRFHTGEVTHGRRPIPAGNRRTGAAPPAAGARFLNGRYADVALGLKYPDFSDVLVPSEMSSRNWMMRRLIIDSIRNDPEWNNGNYTVQPRSARHRGQHAGTSETCSDAGSGR